MKTIYSVKLHFATVAALFTERTYFVNSVQEVDALRADAKAAGYIFVGFSVQHIMSTKEIVQDMIREIGECKRAAGEA